MLMLMYALHRMYVSLIRTKHGLCIKAALRDLCIDRTSEFTMICGTREYVFFCLYFVNIRIMLA